MGAGFHVDVAALQQAADGAKGTVEQVRHRRVSEIDCGAAVVGHERLAAAVTDFCARWSAGVDNLARDVKDIAGRLAECAREYESVDHTASEHLGDVFSRVNGDSPAGS